VAFLSPGIFYQAEYISESLCIILINLSLFLLYFPNRAWGPKKNTRSRSQDSSAASQSSRIHCRLSFHFSLSCINHVIHFPDEARFIRNAIIFLIPLALCIAPVATYNGFVVKSGFSIQANSGFNFFLGNNPDSDGTCYLRPGKKWDETHRDAEKQALAGGYGKDRYFIGEVSSSSNLTFEMDGAHCQKIHPELEPQRTERRC